jgi:hypothetical protein
MESPLLDLRAVRRALSAAKAVLRLILATSGLGLCLVSAFGAWPARAAQGPLLPVFVLVVFLGFAGLGSVGLSVNSPSSGWNRVTWAVAGALFASACISILSIGLLVLLAVMAFSAAAILGTQCRLREIAASVASCGMSSLSVFSLLLFVSNRTDVAMVEVPDGSVVMESFEEIDYVDAFEIRAPKDQSVDMGRIGRVFRAAMMPSSIDESFSAVIHEAEFNQGDVVGTWSIYHRSHDEIITGFDRTFIDFRVSLFVEETDGDTLITATTVARYNNALGRLYFIPIRFGHMIVLGETMRRMKHALTQPDARQME